MQPVPYACLDIINALAVRYGVLSDNLWSHVFPYLHDSFPSARVVDPANTNNIISDDLSAVERGKIRAAAERRSSPGTGAKSSHHRLVPAPPSRGTA